MLDELADKVSSLPFKSGAPVRLLTLSDFATYCQVGKRTVLRWVRQEKLSYENGLRKLPDGDMRIDPAVWSARLRALAGPLFVTSRLIATHHAAIVVFLHSTHLIIARRII